jgi:hypothetical protein
MVGRAPLTFQLSPDNTEWHDLYAIQAATDVIEVTVPVVPKAVYTMPPDSGRNVAFIRFKSGTRAAPVPRPQTANSNSC